MRGMQVSNAPAFEGPWTPARRAVDGQTARYRIGEGLPKTQELGFCVADSTLRSQNRDLGVPDYCTRSLFETWAIRRNVHFVVEFPSQIAYWLSLRLVPPLRFKLGLTSEQAYCPPAWLHPHPPPDRATT